MSPVSSSLCVVRLDYYDVTAEACLGLPELFRSGMSFREAFCALALTRISVIFSPSNTALHLDTTVHLLSLQDAVVILTVGEGRNRVDRAIGFYNLLQQLRRKIIDDVPSATLKVWKQTALFHPSNVQAVSMQRPYNLAIGCCL